MYRPFKVYLAGPIYGQTFDQANDWRDRAIQMLAPEVAGYSPLRGKEFLEEHIEVYGRPIEEHPLLSTRAIMERDFYDVSSSDVILVNLLGASKPSYGTVYELAWAFALRIPLVLIIEPKEELVGLAHDHAWIVSTPFKVSTLEHGVAMVKSILLPNSGSTPLNFTPKR